MSPTPDEITRHHDSRPDLDAAARVPGQGGPTGPLYLVEHDPTWSEQYAAAAALVRVALGERVIALHHVGSTSVAGLPAKPILDVDLVVADPADEAAYVPHLVAVGFVHRLREPWWHEHRLLVRSGVDADATARVTLHVFGPDCPEVVRHLMFADWLRGHPEDRERYAAAKHEAAAATNAVEGTGMDYNRVKEPVVRAIYDRLFQAAGLLD